MSSRNPTDDPEDEDLDDLDDILPTFTKPTPPAPASSSSSTTTTTTTTTNKPPPPRPEDEQGDPEFEAELAKGMESLLRELGMTDDPERGTTKPERGAGEDEMQKLLDKLLSSSMNDASAPIKDEPEDATGLSFEQTIERTMRNMKLGDDEAKSDKTTPQDPLMALLAQLASDPNALKDLNLDGLDLDGLGLGEGDEGSGVLDGMMRGLMTKEILMEPLQELADKYPPFLESQRAHPTVTPTELANYTTQSTIITDILRLFRSPGYSDEDEDKRKEVYALMCRMQEMGSPPEQVMGEMPEGLGFGDEACTIM